MSQQSGMASSLKCTSNLWKPEHDTSYQIPSLTNQKNGVERIKLSESSSAKVNAPTWTTLKIAFLKLVVCFAVMLGLTFSSSDFSLTLHGAFLFLITGALFVLVSRFLAETGFVSVEHQMEEIGLAPKDEDTSKKTS
ncbi:hypothetical protein HAX54_047426 [Datura stramonium]|uniref:Uncharacterized protein n=1 Tax=Datura stramonium TaxID=4076 RepID=A0ABS8SSX0_DATST|nr:hypothetical protein [Datura stramonium]